VKISVAHSPDADDFFLFWPIREKLLSCEDYEFSFTELDTEELNQAALSERFDICAISVAIYPRISEDYLILPSGASVGRKYGPAVVSKTCRHRDELTDAKVAVPGKTTTAALLFQRFAPKARISEAPLTPFERVFEMLESKEVDAAVLIHEGQIAFAERGFHKLLDLGEWWNESTGLPLPLGLNVIHTRLGEKDICALRDLTINAASYARAHLKEIIPSLFEHTQLKRGKLRTLTELEKYLSMYANEDSVILPEDCKLAIAELCGSKEIPRYA